MPSLFLFLFLFVCWVTAVYTIKHTEETVALQQGMNY